MKRLLVTVSCLLLVVGLIGCGQQIPQVSTASSQPQGLSVKGTVYGAKQAQSDAPGDPLAGVTLVLSGQSATRTTMTNANGEYSFNDVPDGTYVITATAEGYQRLITSAFAVNPNSLFGAASPPADNTITTVNIVMNSSPVVLSISPTPGTTIEASAQTIAVVFNEAMDPSSVRPTLMSMGVRTFAITDTQTLTSTWSADSKTLYVTTGALLPNKFYRFNLDPGRSAKDLAGNLLDTSGGRWSNAGGLSDTVYNSGSRTYDYRTASGGAPGAPTGLLLTVNKKTVIDFADANNRWNSVDLSWIAPSSGNISGYNVYVSNGSSGPWALLGATTSNRYTSTVENVNTTLYGSIYNADCIKQLAFVTDTVYFKVAAFNAEGEGTSTAVAIRDATKPTLILANRVARNAGVPAELDAALTDYTAAGATQNMGCYLRFSEPMNLDSLTNATKYTLSGGQTVTGATVVYNNGAVCVVQLTFSAAINPTVDTVTVATDGPVDLSGNVMDSAAGGNVKTIN